MNLAGDPIKNRRFYSRIKICSNTAATRNDMWEMNCFYFAAFFF
jgi:hypothetical protein